MIEWFPIYDVIIHVWGREFAYRDVIKKLEEILPFGTWFHASERATGRNTCRHVTERRCLRTFTTRVRELYFNELSKGIIVRLNAPTAKTAELIADRLGVSPFRMRAKRNGWKRDLFLRPGRGGGGEHGESRSPWSGLSPTRTCPARFSIGNEKPDDFWHRPSEV